jgi:hypothetical protein
MGEIGFQSRFVKIELQIKADLDSQPLHTTTKPEFEIVSGAHASTSNRVVVPVRQAGNRFLGLLKGLQIIALYRGI